MRRATVPDLTPRGRRGRVRRVDGACVAVCALLLAGVLSGCAGARASGVGSAKVTEAGIHAFASAVNLRVGDLPGAEAAAPEGPGPSPGAAALRFASCAGGVSPELVVLELRSTLLVAGRGSLLVRSSAAAWPSEALARRNLAAFASERGARCELRYGGASVSRLAFRLPGGARAVGVRIDTPSQGARAGEIHYHDLVRFVCGPVEIGLTVAGAASRGAAPTEQRLLDLLYRRVRDACGEL
jgi:hypothetical protein